MVKGHSRATIGLYRVLMGLLLLTSTDFLLAGPAPDIVKQKKKVAIPPVEEEVAAAGQNPIGESEQARATKNYGIGARLGGLIDFGVGLDGFVQLDSKTQLGFVFGGGSDSASYSSVDYSARRNVYVNSTTSASSVQLLQLRYFFLNSFSGTLGVGNRVLTSTYEIESFSSKTDKLNLKLATTSLVVSASIGNVWTWKSGFFLGADWIGTIFPLNSRTQKSREVTGADNVNFTEFEQAAEAAATKAGKGPSMIAALGTIGATF